MPKITVSVPHQLTQAEALDRIKKLIARTTVQYGDKVTDLREDWDGGVGTFSGSGAGFSVAGSIAVSASDVAVELKVPMAAMLMKGKIEGLLRAQLSRVLLP